MVVLRVEDLQGGRGEALAHREEGLAWEVSYWDEVLEGVRLGGLEGGLEEDFPDRFAEEVGSLTEPRTDAELALWRRSPRGSGRAFLSLEVDPSPFSCCSHCRGTRSRSLCSDR